MDGRLQPVLMEILDARARSREELESKLLMVEGFHCTHNDIECKGVLLLLILTLRAYSVSVSDSLSMLQRCTVRLSPTHC